MYCESCRNESVLQWDESKSQVAYTFLQSQLLRNILRRISKLLTRNGKALTRLIQQKVMERFFEACPTEKALWAIIDSNSWVVHCSSLKIIVDIFEKYRDKFKLYMLNAQLKNTISFNRSFPLLVSRLADVTWAWAAGRNGVAKGKAYFNCCQNIWMKIIGNVLVQRNNNSSTAILNI